MTRTSLHRILIITVSVIFGSLSAVLSYLVANITTPHIVEYKTFTAMSSEVYAGKVLDVQAVYQKNFDCSGFLIISLDDASPEGWRVIYSQALGDRPVGVWSIIRKIRIPPDAFPGPAILQESLAYTCGWKSETIRSPLIHVVIKEGT